MSTPRTRIAAVELLGPSLLVVLVGLVATQVSQANELYFLNALVAVSMVVAVYVFVGNSGVLSFGQISFVAVGGFASGVMTIPVESKSGVLPDLFPILRDHTLGNVSSLVLAALVGGLLALVARPAADAPLGPGRRHRHVRRARDHAQRPARVDEDRAGRHDALAHPGVLGPDPARDRRARRDGDRLRLSAQPPRAHAARLARGRRGSRGGRRQRAPPAPLGLHAVGRPGRLRRRPLRAHARLDHGRFGLSRAHVPDARDARLRRCHEPLGRGARGARREWSGLVPEPGRAGRQRRRQARPPAGDDAHHPRHRHGHDADPAAVRHHRWPGVLAASRPAPGPAPAAHARTHCPVRVCIVGCGAVGSLFAANLAALDDVEVWAFDRSQPQVDAIAAHGLRLRGAGHVHARLNATSDAAALPPCELGIVATKAMHAESAIAAAAHVFANGAVASVMNGVGNEEVLARHVCRVIRGTTFPAGKLIEPGIVQWDVRGDTTFGPFEQQPATLEEVARLADACTRAGLPSHAVADARPAQWAKVIFNAASNPVGALTGLTHGRVCEQPGLRALISGLIGEGAAVATAEGVVLDSDPEALVDRAARPEVGYDHKASMLQDVEANRPTEIDHLNGGIARLGARLGVRTPLNEAMVALIRGLEESYDLSLKRPRGRARPSRAGRPRGWRSA